MSHGMAMWALRETTITCEGFSGLSNRCVTCCGPLEPREGELSYVSAFQSILDGVTTTHANFASAVADFAAGSLILSRQTSKGYVSWAQGQAIKSG